MTTSNDTITLQNFANSLQNIANRLSAALAKAAPKVRHFVKSVERFMRPWLEEAEQRSQDPGRHSLLLMVEHTQRHQTRIIVQDHEELIGKYDKVLTENREMRKKLWKQKLM